MVTVMEGAEPDQEIFRVLATDADSGELGTIRYGISPSTDTPTRHYFKVDPDSGAISLKKSLEDVDPDIMPFRKISLWNSYLRTPPNKI